MSEPTPRPPPHDDVEAAYRDAVGRLDDAPPPATRAAVLAAARAIAGKSAGTGRDAKAPLPGAGRARAANTPAWRLRGALAAGLAAIAAVVGWRLDAGSNRGHAGVVVASLEAHPEGRAALPMPAVAPGVEAGVAPDRVPEPSPAGTLSARAKVLPRMAAPAPSSCADAAAPALHRAAAAGDVDTLARLLSRPGVGVDAPDTAGRTALLDAVLARQPASVRALLAAGADPAHADHGGLTPRAAAQRPGNADIDALIDPR